MILESVFENTRLYTLIWRLQYITFWFRYKMDANVYNEIIYVQVIKRYFNKVIYE